MRSDGQARRDAILDAALECFGEQGVVATGIEEIRKRAQASPSSVYHLFGGASGTPLQGILLALLARTFKRLFRELAAKVTRTKTAEAAVKALVRGQIDWVLANPLEARVMYQAMTLESSPEVMQPLADAKAEGLSPVVAHFLAFIQEGSLPRWSPLHFDVVLLGATHEAARRYLAGAPLDPAWMKRELPRLAWASLPVAKKGKR